MQNKQLKSRRNECIRIGNTVEKRFAAGSDAFKEVMVYDLLKGTDVGHGEVLSIEGDLLRLRYIDGPTYLEILEEQELLGAFDAAPWVSLGKWLISFNKISGLIQRDTNLGNFIYRPGENKTYGIDFEDCGKGPAGEMISGVCAYILMYEPKRTQIKAKAVSAILGALSEGVYVSEEDIEKKCEALLARREQYKKQAVTACRNPQGY